MQDIIILNIIGILILFAICIIFAFMLKKRLQSYRQTRTKY